MQVAAWWCLTFICHVCLPGRLYRCTVPGESWFGEDFYIRIVGRPSWLWGHTPVVQSYAVCPLTQSLQSALHRSGFHLKNMFLFSEHWVHSGQCRRALCARWRHGAQIQTEDRLPWAHMDHTSTSFSKSDPITWVKQIGLSFQPSVIGLGSQNVLHYCVLRPWDCKVVPLNTSSGYLLLCLPCSEPKRSSPWRKPQMKIMKLPT